MKTKFAVQMHHQGHQAVGLAARWCSVGKPHATEAAAMADKVARELYDAAKGFKYEYRVISGATKAELIRWS